jgi:hypothetical protein
MVNVLACTDELMNFGWRRRAFTARHLYSSLLAATLVGLLFDLVVVVMLQIFSREELLDQLSF